MTTRLLAGDLSASLSFFLASELISAGQNVLTLPEIIIFALLLTIVSTALSSAVKKNGAIQQFPLLENVYEVLDTATFLSSTVIVQLSVRLVRASVDGPLARVITVISTLLLLRVVLTSVSLGRNARDQYHTPARIDDRSE